MLDLSPLQSALGALARALSVTGDAQRWRKFDADTQEALKAGVIQTFEVAYEQGWKMMRRWLALNPLASHAYNRAIAQEVFDLAPAFAQQARKLLLQLEQRND